MGIQEAGCDDPHQQLVLASVTVATNSPAKLGPDETCSSATQKYLDAMCTPRHGTVTKQTETSATCVIESMPSSQVWNTEVDSTTCDGKFKTFSTNTTVIQFSPYGANVDCDMAVGFFKNGQETGHPGACSQTAVPMSV